MPNRQTQDIKKRSPGRPKAEHGEADARQLLIDTAARLFAEQGYSATSLRQVAAGAGVTPAMVAYYFKDKTGLLEAVTIRSLEQLLAVVKKVVAADQPGDDESSEPFLPRFVRGYLATINANPWIPQILLREVISKDTPLRQVFIDRFATEVVGLVPPRVLAEMSAGRLRSDLNPTYTVLSLIGMCLFPYLAQPVLGPLLNYQFDDEFLAAYTSHTLELFLEGAAGDNR